MSFVLNIVYACLVLLALPWFLYQAIARGKYREGFKEKFFGLAPVRRSDRPCIWFHAVSVGEVNLLGVLLKEVTRNRPDVECVISTTTMTGFALAKKKYADHIVFYCPLDFTWAVRTAIRRIRPNLLVLAELELWPNLVSAAKRQGAKVAIVNGRLSERSYRGYAKIRKLLRPTLERIDVVAAQNDEYAERFRLLGAPDSRVFTTGSLKFDGAQSNRDNAGTKRLCEFAGFKADDIVFLAGSTQSPEEKLAIDAFRVLHQAFPQLRLVVVPRHPHRFDEVAALLNESGLAWVRRSELESQPLPTPRILLVDTVGELGAWWGTAAIGFVGGSLFSSRGGQNMIEPAAYGAAVCFGPNTQNFRDVVELLLARKAAVRVHDGDELTAFVQRCLEDIEYRSTLGQAAASVVKQQQGATRRTWELMASLLESNPASQRMDQAITQKVA